VSTRLWRWEERDLGFRFRSGGGSPRHDHYQGRRAGEYYVVSAAHCKLDARHLTRLADAATVQQAPRIVANPWNDYHRDWDWVVSDDGILLNWAGCLDRSEIERREDEGVARAMDVVLGLLGRDPPVPLDLKLVCELHVALMGAIYPFAGRWRRVAITKGAGPIKWPLPPGGIEPHVAEYEEGVLTRTPFLSEDDEDLFAFVAEMMGELLAIHPFREGNGRLSFIVANLVLMQNGLLPLDLYDRRRDEVRYYAACERARRQGDHTPLADLLLEWSDEASARWEDEHGV
jgi:cell filamentation protein